MVHHRWKANRIKVNYLIPSASAVFFFFFCSPLDGSASSKTDNCFESNMFSRKYLRTRTSTTSYRSYVL